MVYGEPTDITTHYIIEIRLTLCFIFPFLINTIQPLLYQNYMFRSLSHVVISAGVIEIKLFNTHSFDCRKSFSFYNVLLDIDWFAIILW